MASLYHGIEIEASLDKVFAAITSQNGLSSWWTADCKVPEPEVGSIVEFGFNGHSVVFKMRVDKVVPSKLVVWKCVGGPKEWKGTGLRWEISKVKGGGELHFTHFNWKANDDHFRMCNSTWDELMYRLKDYAENGTTNPLFK